MEMEVEDDGEFLAAAREDDALVADLLIRLSRSKTRDTWHHRLPDSKPPLLAPTWGRRRARSGALLAAEGGKTDGEEETGRASPATPLSWSGASGTSGSGSDDGWSSPPLRRLQQQQHQGDGVHEVVEPGQPPRSASTQSPEVRHDGSAQIIAPLPQGTAVLESPRRACPVSSKTKLRRSDGDGEPMFAATPAVGYPAAGSGSSKDAAAMARGLGPARTTVQSQPLRSRWTAGGAGSTAVAGRQGKKKTVVELRAMEDSLLQEQEQLQKELVRQRDIYGALLGENIVLKKLESNFPPRAVTRKHAALRLREATSEEPQQSVSNQREPDGVASVYIGDSSREEPQHTSSSSSAQVFSFRFDLNSVPDDDL